MSIAVSLLEPQALLVVFLSNKKEQTSRPLRNSGRIEWTRTSPPYQEKSFKSAGGTPAIF